MNIKQNLSKALVAVCALAPMSAFAATGIIHVKVPFQFVAAGQNMPAGDYNIEASDSGAVLYLQSRGATAMVESATIASGGRATPALVFEKHNGVTYLVRARLGDNSTRSIPTSGF
jgi:hypothetical protein